MERLAALRGFKTPELLFSVQSLSFSLENEQQQQLRVLCHQRRSTALDMDSNSARPWAIVIVILLC